MTNQPVYYLKENGDIGFIIAKTPEETNKAKKSLPYASTDVTVVADIATREAFKRSW